MANPTITINATGITVSGPLIAGEPVAVTASGLSIPEGAALTLALSSRAPNALLASCVLAESEETPGTWTGTLETASRQMAVYFATAAADDTRPAVLELVETTTRDSLALLVTSIRNSALIPSSSPCAVAPVYLPVPGPPGDPQPSDAAPQMDGTAAAGTSDEYARADHVHPSDTHIGRIVSPDGTVELTVGNNQRAAVTKGAGGKYLAFAVDVPPPSDAQPEMDGVASAGDATVYARADHVHPVDTSRASAADVTAIQNLIPSSASTSNKLATAADIPSGQVNADWTATSGPAEILHKPNLATVATSGSYADLTNKPTIPAAQVNSDWDASSGVAQILNKPSLATVATSGSYADLLNKPSIPEQVPADWNATSGVSQILNKPTIPDVSGKADSTSLAPAFSSSSTYSVGDYVTYEGLLYKCTTAVSTAGAWNAANWSAVAVVDEMGADTPLPFDAEVEYIEGFECQFSQYSAGELDVEAEIYFADGYTGNGFAIGKWMTSKCFCIFMDSSKLVARYNNTQSSAINKTTGVWKSVGIHGSVFFYGSTTAAITRAVFGDETSAVGVAVGTDVRIRSLKLNIIGGAPVLDLVPVRVGQIGYLYDKISGTLYATTKSTDPTIGPDKATPTITTPGRIVELTDSPAFTGTPTAPTAAAGTNTTQIATTAFVQSEARYAFASPTPSISGTSATVACEDRAINDFTIATGITSLTITPPAAVTGRARDFLCRVTLTDSSLPTVTLPTGQTVDIGQSEINGMTQGVNLLMFTEIASGHWLASRRSAS